MRSTNNESAAGGNVPIFIGKIPFCEISGAILWGTGL
jgi:hypothetical protein